MMKQLPRLEVTVCFTP